MKLFGNKSGKNKSENPKQLAATNRNAKAAIGLFIMNDTSMLFIELVKKNDLIIVGKYGNITIPFGVLENGRLLDKTGLIKTFKNLYAQVKSDRVLFWDELQQAGIFSENLALAGFTTIRGVSDLRTLLRVFVPDNLTESQVWILKDGPNYGLYHSIAGNTETMGFAENIASLLRDNREKIIELGQKRIMLAGELPYGRAMEYRDVEGFYVQPVNVWQNVCNFGQYVPPINRENSLQYAIPISLALSELAPLKYEDLPTARRETKAGTIKRSLSDSLEDIAPMTPAE